jgi:hypothetical protein
MGTDSLVYTPPLQFCAKSKNDVGYGWTYAGSFREDIVDQVIRGVVFGVGFVKGCGANFIWQKTVRALGRRSDPEAR